VGGQTQGGFSAVVIDGYNLINRVPDLAARLASSGLEATRSYLLGWLRRYQAVRQRRVLLVLDGPTPGRSDFGPVEVLYSVSADEAVVRAAGPGMLVVTSDQAVAGGSRVAGASVLSSEEFWRAMTAGASPAKEMRPRSQRWGRNDSEGADADHEAQGAAHRSRKLTKREKRRRRELNDLLRKV
jgi:predicted RNA-binding protein with PIN domain